MLAGKMRMGVGAFLDRSHFVKNVKRKQFKMYKSKICKNVKIKILKCKQIRVWVLFNVG